MMMMIMIMIDMTVGQTTVHDEQEKKNDMNTVQRLD
jgi:hypothetical protein